MTAAELRVALKALRLRERLLADRLGVAPDTVYGWTNGGLPVPQYAVAFVELLLTDQRPEPRRSWLPWRRG